MKEVELFINYKEYVNADIVGKKMLMIKNVLKSVKALKGKGKIDYNMFENDMKVFCEENGVEI